jgi:DNA-binding IclR family transcriptional regulator
VARPSSSRTAKAPRRRRDKGSAIERAMAIIAAAVGEARPRSASEFAVALDVPKPTVHRICLLLERDGFLQREPAARGFVVGPRLTGLALDILRASARLASRHAILKALSEAVGETCNLGVFDGRSVVYIDRVEAGWPLRLHLQAGSRVDLHCTAMGKLFLSHLPPADRARLLRVLRLERFTDHTITDAEKLERECARIRREGYATDDQEFLAGVACVAVPILDGEGRIAAAVALQAAEARLSLRDALKHLPRLEKAAAQFAVEFGDRTQLATAKKSVLGARAIHHGRRATAA